MSDVDFIDDVSVLLLEESLTLQDLFDDWLPEVPTRAVTTPSAIPAEFDASVAVVCLSLSALDDTEKSIRKFILNRNPYCQLIAVLPRSSLVTLYEDNYDACIQRPIFEAEFQQLVKNRLAYGVYSSLLREFYDLNTKLLWIRRREPNAVANADIEPDELQKRYQDLCTQLDELEGMLSSKDITEISRSIDLHKRYLTEPDSESQQGSESKYHPDRCPACKLSWGVDHGNDLGTGVASLGAGVWQCTRCDEIVHGLGEGGRRVMKG